MKKIILIVLIFMLSVGVAVSAPTSTIVQNLYISDLSSSGDPCLVISSAGLISTSTCGGVSLWTATNGDIYRLTGSIGIGTSTPQTALHVTGELILTDVSGLGAHVLMIGNTAKEIADPYITVHDSNTTDNGVDMELVNTATSGADSNAVYWLGADNETVGAGFVADGFGTYSDGTGSPAVGIDVWTNHPFWIGTNATPRFHITADGKVGIGTSTPQTAFHLVGTPRWDLGSDATSDIFFRNSSGNVARLAIGADGKILTASSTASGGLSWEEAVGGLWTDAGDFTYLTATDDDLAIGSSTAALARLHVRGVVIATSPENPLQDTGMVTVVQSVFDMNAGYKFTPSVDGIITQLGLRCNSGDRVVRLYDFASGDVLASTTITANGVGTWVYADITPITVTSSVAYVVAQRSEGGLNYCRTAFSTPTVSGNVTINDSRYSASTNAMPTAVINFTQMYGHADVTFIPEIDYEIGMIIEDGNVGIGVVVPTEKLIVAGNIVSGADSTYNLGTSATFWANAYIDEVYVNKVRYEAAPGSANYMLEWCNNTTCFFQNFGGGISKTFFGTHFLPSTDSTKDLGDPSWFWDEAFIDEIVLQQGTMGSTAANQVRLAGLDLSAGDAGLHIKTENDTEHLFASLVGIGTTNPGSLLTLKSGDIFLTTSTVGIILTSPDGTCARGTIDNANSLTFADVTCPSF